MSSTIATHQPPATTSAAAPASSQSLRAAAQRAGRGDHPHERERGDHEVRLQALRQEREADERAGRHEPRVPPASTARTRAYAPATSSSVRIASGLLKRNMSAATGVSARAAPASSAAAGPNQRRTIR